MAIVVSFSSISVGFPVQANPSATDSEQVGQQSAHLVSKTAPEVRRYGGGKVAIDAKIETVSGTAELALAEHLAKSGAQFYGAHWCSHCHKQKALFGATAATKLPYIECAKDAPNSRRELCRQKNIQMFPSWLINGQLISGTRELKDLAAASGYQGPMNFKHRK